jgi:hypothetical protein
MYQTNVVPPSSGLKRKPRKQPARCNRKTLLGLLLNSDDGGSTFLQNIHKLLTGYKALVVFTVTTVRTSNPTEIIWVTWH